EVSGTNSLGIVSAEAATLPVVVQPFWWQRTVAQVIGVVLAAAFLLFFYRSRVAAFRRRQTVQADFSRQLIDSQEEERKRIAGELHDSLGQHLLLIKNSTEFARQKLEDDSPLSGRFEELTDIASDALTEVRAITSNLRPTGLDRFGLRVAAQSMADQFAEHTGIRVNHNLVDLEQNWDESTQIAIYRLIQESLNSGLKHAAATEIAIEAEATPEHL
ncbi:MAG: hypothetical protein GY953_49985, partial [bacterium]|nr:hypothetical protein [bacterium]